MMLETAETKFVEVRGTKYAYRSVGNDVGNLPLVFLQHFTGTMDGWDPLVVNGLAKHRLVVVFDNAGVASSSGTTPDNVAQMAIDAQDFISALGSRESRPPGLFAGRHGGAAARRRSS